MKLAISFGSAFVLHAAVATGVILHHSLPGAALGRPGSLPATVEVEQLPPPVVPAFAVAVNAVTPAAKPSHTRSVVSVHVEAVTAPSASATADDAVPVPLPAAPPPRFHGATAMAAVTMTAGADAEQTFAESEVTERARCIASPDPVYPEGALAADDVEPDTRLRFELVVDTSGLVAEVRALNHAGHGFDESALAALRTYRFTPAKRDQQLVRVRMPWTVQFKLK